MKKQVYCTEIPEINN